MIVVPSSNTIEVLEVNLEIWHNQISKNPILIKINWSSWPKSQNPGTRFANSTTRWTLGVILFANWTHNQHLSCSNNSAVEEATSPSSGLGGGGFWGGFFTMFLVCSSVYPQLAWWACETVRIISYTANCLESASDWSASDVETLEDSSVLRSRDRFGTRPYRTAKEN